MAMVRVEAGRWLQLFFKGLTLFEAAQGPEAINKVKNSGQPIGIDLGRMGIE